MPPLSRAARVLERRLNEEERRRRQIINELFDIPDDVQSTRLPRQLGRRVRVPRVPRVARITRAELAPAPEPTVLGGVPMMGSSVVQYLDYMPDVQIVNVRLGAARFRTRNYHYLGVPLAVFNQWWEGAATCRTNDKSSLRRWHAGDTPSLGAFYNQHIRGRYELREGFYNG